MGNTVARKNSLDMCAYARMKTFGESGYYEILSASRPLFRMPGWELRPGKVEQAEREIDFVLDALGWREEVPSPVPAEPDPEKAAANLARAARRAALAVRDLALTNRFSWFITLTLDRQHIDRYDINVITQKLNRWLSNMVQRYALRYVIVAERHKDGAIHFHGLVNDVPGFVPSGTWNVPGHKKPIKPRSKKQAAAWAAMGAEQGYHEVYNWERWPLGFSTGIRLYGEYDRAVGYVCKYIRKQTKPVDGVQPGKIGGRWYYSGGQLLRPAVEYLQLDTDWMRQNCPDAYFFAVDEAKAEFGLYRWHDAAGGKFLPPQSEFTKTGLLTDGKK